MAVVSLVLGTEPKRIEENFFSSPTAVLHSGRVMSAEPS